METNKCEWAAAMTAFLTDAHNTVKAHKARGIPAIDDALLAEYRARYDEILEQGRLEFLKAGRRITPAKT